MNNIGKAVLKIDKLLEEKNISKSKFAREVKIQYRQLKKYYNNDMKKLI